MNGFLNTISGCLFFLDISKNSPSEIEKFASDTAIDAFMSDIGKGITISNKSIDLEKFMIISGEKKFCANIDSLEDSEIEKYSDLLKKFSQRIVTSSSNQKYINLIRKKVPQAATAFTYTELVKYYAMFRSGLFYFKKKFRGNVFITPEFAGISHIANESFIKDSLKKGIIFFINGINDEKSAKRVIESGAKGIITENLLLAKSENRTLKHPAL